MHSTVQRLKHAHLQHRTFLTKTTHNIHYADLSAQTEVSAQIQQDLSTSVAYVTALQQRVAELQSYLYVYKHNHTVTDQLTLGRTCMQPADDASKLN